MKPFVVFLFIVIPIAVFAQQPPRVVMHLQTNDTLVYRSIVNQVSNMKKEIPDVEIAVVCHGPGMDFMLNTKSTYINKLEKMKLSNVSFIGCEFTMKQRNLTKSDLVPYAKTVPYALVDIVKKQQDNWIYVKLGF
ncbi:MAG: DsrE family protein [Cyclobacteriaceae bacterium]|nr:DsrE family protein [Cyclobacteriaceae bacterium]UYN86303.1 MAG: DsrE family protein [Cyclobacteriaceae bacterium]